MNIIKGTIDVKISVPAFVAGELAVNESRYNKEHWEISHVSSNIVLIENRYFQREKLEFALDIMEELLLSAEKDRLSWAEFPKNDKLVGIVNQIKDRYGLGRDEVLWAENEFVEEIPF